MTNKRIRRKHKNQEIEIELNMLTLGHFKTKRVRKLRRNIQHKFLSISRGIVKGTRAISEFLANNSDSIGEYKNSKSVKEQLDEDFKKSMKGGARK